MLRNKLNNKKKKKGFTLIELVIVLAVLAIIAVIAIPNFTKIRTKSIIESDYRAAEQIEKITLMGIANQDIPSSVKQFTVGDNGAIVQADPTGVANPEYEDLFREANGPQVPSLTTKTFTIDITDDGAVNVSYTGVTNATIYGGMAIGPVLAGPDAIPAAATTTP